LLFAPLAIAMPWSVSVQDAIKYQEFYGDLEFARLECQRRRDASKHAEKNGFISIYSKMSSESSWGRLMRQRFRFKFLKMDYNMNITETTPREAVLGNVVHKMKLNDEFSDWATRKIRQIASDADEVTEVFAILVGDRLNRQGLKVFHRCVRKSKGTGMLLEELMSRMPDPSGYLCCAYGRYANTLAALSKKDRRGKWMAFLSETSAVKIVWRIADQYVNRKQLFKQLAEAPESGPVAIKNHFQRLRLTTIVRGFVGKQKYSKNGSALFPNLLF
jgi:hypothetical protein